MVHSLWKTVWQSLKMINIELPYDPAIPLLGVYSRGLKTYIYTKTFTQMLIAELFIIAKNWEHLKCPSTDEWINKMWYIYNKILFGYTKEWHANACYNMDKLWKHYAKWKMLVTKGYILYNSTFMKCLQEANL